MTGPTHVITGLATVVAISRLSSVTPSAVELLALIFGVLAPDIDGGGVITRPGKVLRQLVGRVLADVIDFLFGIVVALVSVLFSHRGFLHSPAFAVVVFGLAWASGEPLAIWFSVGYAVHLVGDVFTAGGIPIGSPFSTRTLSLGGLRTGSLGEFAIAVVLLVFTCLFGWSTLPEGVKASHREVYKTLVVAKGSS